MVLKTMIMMNNDYSWAKLQLEESEKKNQYTYLHLLDASSLLSAATVAKHAVNKLAPSIHVVTDFHKVIYWLGHIHDASHTRSYLEPRKCVLNL